MPESPLNTPDQHVIKAICSLGDDGLMELLDRQILRITYKIRNSHPWLINRHGGCWLQKGQSVPNVACECADEAFMRIMEGRRQWNHQKYNNFEAFFAGAVDSILSEYVNPNKKGRPKDCESTSETDGERDRRPPRTVSLTPEIGASIPVDKQREPWEIVDEAERNKELNGLLEELGQKHPELYLVMLRLKREKAIPEIVKEMGMSGPEVSRLVFEGKKQLKLLLDKFSPEQNT
jgi:RNA polymerase sigma factor (sigma-70 family)